MKIMQGHKNQYIMKKLICLSLLLFTLSSFGQNAKYGSKIRDEYYGTGVPNFGPASYPAIAVDTVGMKVYVRDASTLPWKEVSGQAYNVFLYPPQQTAPPPTEPPVNTSLLLPCHYPQNYGAVGENKTLGQLGYTQAQIDAKYPGVGATPADNADWAALQYCFNLQAIDGKMIITSGTLWMGSKDVVCRKSLLYSMWLGGGTMIYSNANNVITREKPADNGDANVMIQAQYVWESIIIKCMGSQTQTGIQLFSVYPVNLRAIKVFNAKKAYNLVFCLQGFIQSCEANGSIDGFVADVGTPYYSTTNDQSQCNVLKYQSCRVYAPNNGRYGFWTLGSNAVWYDSPVLEGFKMESGIYVNGLNSTTVKDSRVINAHFEVVGGTTVAAFNVELAGGQFIIDAPYGQHASKMVRAKATTGYITVQVINCMWWMPDAAGKFFQSDGGASWFFGMNDNQLYSISPSAMFSGYVPSLATTPGQGWNVYSYVQIPRK
jgi:hypothetical protein